MARVPSLPPATGYVNILVFNKGQLIKIYNHLSYQPKVSISADIQDNKITEGQSLSFSGNNIPQNEGAVVVLFNNVKGIPSKPLEIMAPLGLTKPGRFENLVILDDRCQNYANIKDERYNRYYEKCKRFIIPKMSLDTNV